MGGYAGALAELGEALRAAPKFAETNARLARFLATCPDEELRDADLAVSLAERARDLTGGRSGRVLDTLAAAYAAAGRFSEAVTAAHQSQQRARLDGDDALATEIEERLALYAVGEAWVAPGVGDGGDWKAGAECG